MFRRRGIFPSPSGTFLMPPGNGATPAVHRKTDTKEKCVRSMAGPPHRQRLSCAEYGKRDAKSSARHRPCYVLPENPPNIRSGIPRPIRITVGHRKGCRRHPAFRKPVRSPLVSQYGDAAPRGKSLRPFLPALLKASSCAAPPAPERLACSLGMSATHRLPPPDAPPARPLRAPALYWQGVRAVCGRSLSLPTREVFHGRPAMHPHPPFLPLL